MPKADTKFLVRHRTAGFLVTKDVFCDLKARACRFESGLDAVEAVRQVFGEEVLQSHEVTILPYQPHHEEKHHD